MKKLCLLFILFCSTCGLFAQNTSSKKTVNPIQLGVKGGLNLATFKNVKGNFISNPDTRIGFHAGLLAHIHISGHFALQPEVTFSTQGAKNPANKYITNYINIPLLAQYMFTNGFRLQTGPQAGLLVEALTADYANNQNPSFKTFLRSTDFSWSFGAGYLSDLGVGLDARYNLGISNVRNDPAQALKNRVWQFGIFYQFMR